LVEVEPYKYKDGVSFRFSRDQSSEAMEPPPPSPDESPTRYMLPNTAQDEEGKGLVDYSLNPHSPAKYPLSTKKRKKTDKKKKNKKLKQEPGKRVHFHA